MLCKADHGPVLVRLVCANAAQASRVRDGLPFSSALRDRLRHLILIGAEYPERSRRRNQNVDSLCSRERAAQRIRIENIGCKSIRPAAHKWRQFLAVASHDSDFLPLSAIAAQPRTVFPVAPKTTYIAPPFTSVFDASPDCKGCRVRS